MKNISMKIGIVTLLLILVMVLSSVIIGAQSPYATSTTTAVSSATPTATATATATAKAIQGPGIAAFEIGISEVSGNTEMANVKLNISFRNFDFVSGTATSTATGTATSEDTVQRGLIKFCYDMTTAAAIGTPSATAAMTPAITATPTASAAATQTAIPKATSDATVAQAGQCLLAAVNHFTFENVPKGVHTFGVEMVDASGNSLMPREYLNITIMVTPTSSGIFGG